MAQTRKQRQASSTAPRRGTPIPTGEATIVIHAQDSAKTRKLLRRFSEFTPERRELVLDYAVGVRRDTYKRAQMSLGVDRPMSVRVPLRHRSNPQEVYDEYRERFMDAVELPEDTVEAAVTMLEAQRQRR